MATPTIELTEDEYIYLDDNYIGLCIKCHEERECCEPDARKYPCDNCNTKTVYGAGELLVMGIIEFTEE
jgi:hypothetical protein